MEIAIKTASASGILFGLLLFGHAPAQVAPGGVASTAGDEETIVPAPVDEPPAQLATMGTMFVTSEPAASIRQIRERLQDPAKRTQVRAEQRAQIEQTNAGVGRALGIDAATENALFELLTEHQMEQLDAFHLGMGDAPRNADHRQVIDETRYVSDHLTRDDPARTLGTGGSATILVGRKAYILEIDTQIEAL
jgi:hypothetical protein